MNTNQHPDAALASDLLTVKPHLKNLALLDSIGKAADFLERQVRLRGLCDEIAKHDGIETRRFSMTFNDGVDCEYEYLDGFNIFAVELLRDHGAAVETYDITVKRNLRDSDGRPTREWEIVSESRMASAVMS